MFPHRFVARFGKFPYEFFKDITHFHRTRRFYYAADFFIGKLADYQIQKVIFFEFLNLVIEFEILDKNIPRILWKTIYIVPKIRADIIVLFNEFVEIKLALIMKTLFAVRLRIFSSASGI